ncbi:MAG: penicillin-binding transpeptidase domain-containing protein [Sumerlaeia bacterium]
MEHGLNPLDRSPGYPRRHRVTLVLLALGALLLASRLTWLTAIDGPEYRRAAQDNIASARRLQAPRGNIFDHRGQSLARSRKAYTLTYSRYGRSKTEVKATLNRLDALLAQGIADRYDEIIATRPSWTRHDLVENAPQESVTAILERPNDFRGVRIHETFRREYPHGTAFATVLGHVGRIPAERAETYRRPTYLPDATVGRSGLESRWEDRLVGKPGREALQRDARGRLLQQPLVERPALPGDDLVLTLDAAIQKAAYDALLGFHGAAVMIDVETGALRALASAPSYDPAAPWRQEADGQPVSFLNRAFQGRYPPASPFKAITGAAVLKDGHSPAETLYCSGSYTLRGWDRPFRCDGFHGPTALPRALQVSCNSYFYQMAEAIGGERIQREAAAFGLGRASGLDLPGERTGSLGSASPNTGETLNIAIGQGALLVTPLQMARAYCALANGGRLPVPHVVQAIRRADGTVEDKTPTGEERVLLPDSVRRPIVEGLSRVVETGGTAARADFPPEWDVCGKTGTGENGRGGVDAWFACFYPRSAPRYAVVVVVEDAPGHGGDIAAPIVRAIIAAERAQTERAQTEEAALAAAPSLP